MEGWAEAEWPLGPPYMSLHLSQRGQSGRDHSASLRCLCCPGRLLPSTPTASQPLPHQGALSRATFSGLLIHEVIQKGLGPSLSPGHAASVLGLLRLLGPFSPLRLCPARSKASRDVPALQTSAPTSSSCSPETLLPPNARRGFLSWASDMSAWKWGTHSLLEGPGATVEGTVGSQGLIQQHMGTNTGASLSFLRIPVMHVLLPLALEPQTGGMLLSQSGSQAAGLLGRALRSQLGGAHV